MAEKTYINGLFIKKKSLQFGEVISVSCNADALIEEIKKHKNAKGYFNMTFMNRKEEDKNGNNMYAVLDTYTSSETKTNNEKQAVASSDDDGLPF